MALEWIARKEKNRSARYGRQIKHVLKTDVFPVIGSRPIASVTAADLLGILQRVEGRKLIAKGGHSTMTVQAT